MTRTVAFGEPPARLRDVHDLVRSAQQAGIDAVRMGATGAEVDGAARDVIEGAGLGSTSPTGSATVWGSRSTRGLAFGGGATTCSRQVPW